MTAASGKQFTQRGTIDRRFWGLKYDFADLSSKNREIIFKICEICDVPLARYKPELSFRLWREGKSGQRRTTHRLIAGFPPYNGKEKVPQKITTHGASREKR